MEESCDDFDEPNAPTLNNLKYTDKEVQDVVEELVKIKERKYAKRFISFDDIGQEVRMKCWKILHRYDPGKDKTLKTFLNVATENHLMNLMRDTFGTFNPPHKNNPDYFKNGRPTEKALSDEKIVAYMKMFAQKRAVKMPTSSEITPDVMGHSSYVMNGFAEGIDLDLSIREVLERDFPYLIKSYEVILSGGRVSKTIRMKIQEIVSSIMKECSDD